MPDKRQGAETPTEAGGSGYAFGTFGGVFTPSILTIFGLIMFMRASYVVGGAGVVRTLVILTLSSGITLLTGLSLSAISTNTPVAGGGAYYLISRVLGPAFGTAIGIALFAAQALSVPFYILGFVEALRATFQIPLEPWLLCLITLLLLVGLAWVGAQWAIRVQYLVLAVLVASIVVLLTGAGKAFSLDTFHANLGTDYPEGMSFWRLFAVYFPAVTGIMAGVNMSGDLKNPARAIPLGTLAAIGISFLVYGAEIVLCGGMASSADLKARPFEILVTNAWFGLGFMVVAGVFCATLSSAIGSILGAPRVLQAVARDGTLRVVNPFRLGAGAADEPRRALALTTAISAVTLILASQQQGGKGLDLVAQVVTMVFLYTYGMTNLAAFVESFGANPSFRPRFRFFHWSTALAGAVGCAWTAFQIHVGAAALALAVLAVLYAVARKQEVAAAYGDARRGFVYQRLRRNLLSLAAMPMHPKNWRPTIAVLAGSPNARLGLVTHARWLGINSGIVSLVSILTGRLEDMAEERAKEEKRLRRFIEDNALDVLPEVVVLDDFDHQLAVFLQSFSVGPIKPNIILLGFARDPERLSAYYQHLRTMVYLRKSVVAVVDRGLMLNRPRKRIDCWWRGQENGSLMIILAHLLMLNPEWNHTQLRLLRMLPRAEDVPEARRELERICHAGRMTADIVTPVSTRPFAEAVTEHSEDATLVLIGFRPPAPEQEEAFQRNIDAILEGLPSVLLVCSAGEADLHA